MNGFMKSRAFNPIGQDAISLPVILFQFNLLLQGIVVAAVLCALPSTCSTTRFAIDIIDNGYDDGNEDKDYHI